MSHPQTDLIDMVFEFCTRIKNGRNLGSIMYHSKGEMKELEDEVEARRNGTPEGEDGIKGEAVDVMLMMIDFMFMEGMTKEEIYAYAQKKCEKWERKWG